MASSPDSRNVSILPPEEFTGLKLTSPKSKAAGITGVWASYKHIRKEMGVWEGFSLLAKMNQSGGFDCSGCAWPDPQSKKRSGFAEYCENGAKALAEEATHERCTPEFFAQYSVGEMSRWSDYRIGKSGRITEPMVLRKGKDKYESISWKEAFALISVELNTLKSPDEAIFYTSGRTANETAYLYQLFVREYGTNNMPDCSNMCHESSGTGLSETVGIGKGSVTLEDLHIAEVIMVMGQNPGTNHPRMLSALRECKKNGGQIVHVNPLPETGLRRFVDPQNPLEILKGGTQLSDIHVPVKINGDIGFLKGLMLLMLNAEEANPGTVFDHTFIEEKTEGYAALIADLKNTSIEECIAASGISLPEMQRVADLLIRKEKIIICWAMGLTQHVNGVKNIREVVNLLLLKGSIGKAGAGTCPVRGHSNVQGDRTMGIWEKPKAAFLDALKNHFGFEPPREHGYDTVAAIEAMRDHKAKVFIGMGGNFISATPDSEVTGKALQNCRLTVQISTKLNRAHLVTGEQALILPCIARSEADVQKGKSQFISMENSMGIVHQSKGVRKPASDKLLSEPAIVAGMALATLKDRTKVDWQGMVDDYNKIRDNIEATIPGFKDYNKRVLQPNGFYLPNGARKGKFNTASGKAHFSINEIPDHDLNEGEYLMMTIRTHDQYNTTIYGLNDRYRGILNERRVVMMNREDMKAAGLSQTDIVDLKSHWAGETRTAHKFLVVPFDIPSGNVATYFPETNVLVPLGQKADRSHTPASKSVKVTVHKVG